MSLMETSTRTPLLLLGCGFLGRTIARMELARGRHVRGTTRDPDHARELHELGVEPIVADPLEPGALREPWLSESDVIVTFPPDESTDAAVAPAIRQARSSVYVSSTGVYGTLRGRVDENTPAEPETERGRRRLEAERIWRDAGAAIVRPPAIYGDERGVHIRLKQGRYRLTEDGDRHVSRIHVHDLARACLAALQHPSKTYLVGDRQPTTQRELVAWLCERMQLEMPPKASLRDAPPTLRADRIVDPSHALAELGVSLRYPTYREGYGNALLTRGWIREP